MIHAHRRQGQVRIAGGRDPVEARKDSADVVPDRPHEAFGIDAHPEHRGGDRRQEPPFARVYSLKVSITWGGGVSESVRRQRVREALVR